VTLLVVSVWLQKLGRPIRYTLAPMLFVGVATAIAMFGELQGYFANFDQQWLLAGIGSLILVLDLWVIYEGLRMLARGRRLRPSALRL
jgi:carbon starvation protein